MSLCNERDKMMRLLHHHLQDYDITLKNPELGSCSPLVNRGLKTNDYTIGSERLTVYPALLRTDHHIKDKFGGRISQLGIYIGLVVTDTDTGTTLQNLSPERQRGATGASPTSWSRDCW